MLLTKARLAAVMALLGFVTCGIPLATPDLGCAFQIKDPITGTWRDATPVEMTGFADQTGDIVHTTIATTPLAPALPWIDMVLRLSALFAAWRIIPASAATTQPPSPAATAQGAVAAGSLAPSPSAIVAPASNIVH